jgi:hypothetical protein
MTEEYKEMMRKNLVDSKATQRFQGCRVVFRCKFGDWPLSEALVRVLPGDWL